MIQQPYTSRTPSGGFLNVVIQPSDDATMARLDFRFYDENGVLLHTVEKTRAVE